MNILNEKEQKRLADLKLEFVFAISEAVSMSSNEHRAKIDDGTVGVLNALAAFGAEYFVVSCIGMLKAGKSTLINLFARSKDASPTGFGFDTTLRPALITGSTEPRGTIEVWLPNTPEQKLTKASLTEVFLCLRKVKKPEEVKGASYHVYPLMPANLENALCKAVLEADNNMLPCEPVMVVVKVPQNKESPLTSEIILLDTPGLDSGISNWTKDSAERYSWIIENSDLLLFLQSSVAPLNKNAAAILRDIHAKSPNTPVWLVQNEMCAKPWLPLERITEENTKQRTQAARMFNNISHAFKLVYANLGKADSAIFDDTLGGKLRITLLNESQFRSVEANIKNDLISNIGPIRRRNCIDAVIRETALLMDGFAQIEGELEQKRQSAQARVAAITRFKSQYRDYMLDTPRDGDNPAVNEIKFVPTGHFSTAKYRRELHNIYDFGFKEKLYSSAKLQRIITRKRDAIVKQMKDDIRAITTDDFVLALRRNGERRNNICKYVHEVFQDFALRMLKDDGIKFDQSFPVEEAGAMIRSVVERLQLPGLQDGFFVNVDEVAGKATITVRKLDWWKNLLWEFRKRDADEAQQVFADYFNPATETGPFAELIEAVEIKVREAVAVWMNETAFDTLRDEFIKQMDNELTKCLQTENECVSLIVQNREAIKNANKKCNDLNNQMKEL